MIEIRNTKITDENEKQAAQGTSKVEKYFSALTEVMDPELEIDIVNLGMIYDLQVKNNICQITMTLTNIGCTIENYLKDKIKNKLFNFDEIKQVKIKLVCTPAWSINKMSYRARYQLGIH